MTYPTTVDEIEWGSDAEPVVQTAKPRRCRRHEWEAGEHMAEAFGIDGRVLACARCGRLKDESASRRARNNRSRGNAIERAVCKLLGISRVGQYGGAEDGGRHDEWLIVQVKSGGAYPERIDRLLRALPANADQLRAVVHADTPGGGARRRMLITLDAYDFAQWFRGSRE